MPQALYYDIDEAIILSSVVLNPSQLNICFLLLVGNINSRLRSWMVVHLILGISFLSNLLYFISIELRIRGFLLFHLGELREV